MRNVNRPNIIYLYTDQLRLDALSCYGNSAISTPNIDKIAQKGIKLNNYFVNSPVCSPSRMSFLTGRYCSSLNVGWNGIPIPKESTPISKLLKQYNYKTANIGKLHFDPHARRNHKNPTDTYGFDTFILSDEPGCYDDAYSKWVESIDLEALDKTRTSIPPAAKFWGKKEYTNIGRETHEPYDFAADEDLTHTAFVASEVCSYIENYIEKNPFFLIAGFYAPHTPVNPPKKYLDRVNINNIKLPIKGNDEIWMNILEGIDENRWKEIIKYYYALILHLDDYVGKILEKLEEKNMMEDTIIVFTSDHGEYLGDHGKIQKGMPGFDCIINVPMLISYPRKIKAGRVLDILVEGVDIVPTMLDFATIQTPSFVQGKSIYNNLIGKEDTKNKSCVLVEYFEQERTTETTIRNKKFMYSINQDGKELLFDLRNDKNQLNNVAYNETYNKHISDMRKEMILKIQEASYCSKEKIDEY